VPRRELKAACRGGGAATKGDGGEGGGGGAWGRGGEVVRGEVAREEAAREEEAARREGAAEQEEYQGKGRRRERLSTSAPSKFDEKRDFRRIGLIG